MSDPVALYAEHMHRRALAATTIERRVAQLRMLEAALPTPLLEASTLDIERFLDARTGRYTPRMDPHTRVNWCSGVHQFYQWAVAEELTRRDPSARLVRPKLGRKLPRPLPEADYRRAVDLAPNATMRAWVLLGGNAGLRVCEIASLRGEDVTADSLRVTGKGRKTRVVPMHRRVAEVAEGWPGSGLVFEHIAGGPWRPHQVSKLVGAYLRSIGLNAKAHQLRHRFGTAVYEATGDLAVVAELLGHESIETTRVYSLVSQARRAQAVDGIE